MSIINNSEIEPTTTYHIPSTTYQRAFTIVELLVVIVVIAILAAISFVSYSGISQKVITSSLRSDLAQASKQMKLYQVEHGTFPVGYDANKCPTGPVAPSPDTRYCIKSSKDSTFTYSPNTTTYQSFTLDNTHTNGMKYRITEGTEPTLVIIQPITAIGAITGTTTAGSILTAGIITPAAATITYQWQISTTSNGTYTDISSATTATYVIQSSDWPKYIRVTATGIGDYSGVISSTAIIVSDPNWMTIGTQTWAKYNLNVGTRISSGTEQTNNATIEKYCYEEGESNCIAFNSGLYQWDEAMQYGVNAPQGICPTGSHIPSDNDWKTLEMYLGMTQAQADATGWRGSDQGTKLRPGGSSGFEMLLSGYRYSNSTFAAIYSDTSLWSSTESTSSSVWARYISGYPTVYRSAYPKTMGFPVRCLAN